MPMRYARLCRRLPDRVGIAPVVVALAQLPQWFCLPVGPGAVAVRPRRLSCSGPPRTHLRHRLYRGEQERRRGAVGQERLQDRLAPLAERNFAGNALVGVFVGGGAVEPDGPAMSMSQGRMIRISPPRAPVSCSIWTIACNGLDRKGSVFATVASGTGRTGSVSAPASVHAQSLDRGKRLMHFGRNQLLADCPFEDVLHAPDLPVGEAPPPARHLAPLAGLRVFNLMLDDQAVPHASSASGPKSTAGVLPYARRS